MFESWLQRTQLELGLSLPMVTKSGMGSGLISNTENQSYSRKSTHGIRYLVSMKMRLGYESPQEIIDVLPILDKYPLKNIAIHARLGKQLYKGGVDLDGFSKCIDTTKHKLLQRRYHICCKIS
jgi:tRNA-dihydrouridine synthase